MRVGTLFQQKEGPLSPKPPLSPRPLLLLRRKRASCFVVGLDDVAEDLCVFEILGIDDVDFADHAEVFNRQDRNFLFAQFVQAGAFRQNGHAEIAANQIFDGRDVVDFKNDVKIADEHVLTLERRDEKIARVGVRQAEDHLLLF